MQQTVCYARHLFTREALRLSNIALSSKLGDIAPPKTAFNFRCNNLQQETADFKSQKIGLVTQFKEVRRNKK